MLCKYIFYNVQTQGLWCAEMASNHYEHWMLFTYIFIYLLRSPMKGDVDRGKKKEMFGGTASLQHFR